MEVQNVSAQLFMKQLPSEQLATHYGCDDPEIVIPKELSLCDDFKESKLKIESAFQQQLTLSELYKSNLIFESIKKDYMGKIMEGEQTSSPILDAVYTEPVRAGYPESSGYTGPLGKMSKETFGKGSSSLGILSVGTIVVIAFFAFMLLKEKRMLT